MSVKFKHCFYAYCVLCCVDWSWRCTWRKKCFSGFLFHALTILGHALTTICVIWLPSLTAQLLSRSMAFRVVVHLPRWAAVGLSENFRHTFWYFCFTFIILHLHYVIAYLYRQSFCCTTFQATCMQVISC